MHVSHMLYQSATFPSPKRYKHHLFKAFAKPEKGFRTLCKGAKGIRTVGPRSPGEGTACIGDAGAGQSVASRKPRSHGPGLLHTSCPPPNPTKNLEVSLAGQRSDKKPRHASDPRISEAPKAGHCGLTRPLPPRRGGAAASPRR